MLKSYLLAVALVVWTVLCLGFILPWAISANSTFIVLAGVAFALFGFIPLAWKTVKAFLASTPEAIAEQKTFWKRIFPLIVLAVLVGACSRVPVGDVGIKVKSVGTDKGVEAELLTTGYYWISWNEQLYLFPVAMQQYVWTVSNHEGATHDESMTFQDRSGIALNADFGIAYTFDLKRIPQIFQTYRLGADEIRDITVRNEVRDTLVAIAAQYSIDDLIGPKKEEFLSRVNAQVKTDLEPRGIVIDRIYSVDRFRILDPNIQAAINNKIHAIQLAEQKENELRQSKADAAKLVAAADGQAQAQVAKAEGEAKAKLTIATAQAQANTILAKTLSPELIQWAAVTHWNGSLPAVTGSAVPFIDLGAAKAVTAK